MNSALIPNRTLFARLFYGLTLLFLLLRWKNQLMLSQLQQPVMLWTGTDFTYILFALTGVPRFLVQHYWAAFSFDVLLTITAVAAFFYPRQNKISIAFTVLLGLYIVTEYSFLCFHKHNLTGMWFASLIFLPATDIGFSIWFGLVRYYCLFAYASSGFWKLYRGVWHSGGHLDVILKGDILQYMFQHPGSFLTQLITWLLAHPQLTDGMMMATSLFQLSYIIGFFTRRLDGFFLVFAFVFHILSLLLLRAFFMEFSLILITLLPLSMFYRKQQEA